MKNIIEARSKENGIVFYSNLNQLIGYEVYREETGQIGNQIVFTQLDEFFQTKENKDKEVNKWLVVFLDAILISIGVMLRSVSVIIGALYFSLTISNLLFNEVKCIFEIKSKNGTSYSLGKYHSAEHMAIAAYESMQKIPTIEEAKQFSRFSKECGSNEVINKTLFFLLLSIELALGDVLIFPYDILLMIFTTILIIVAGEKKWFRFLQVCYTNVPSDDELEVAIEGIKMFDYMEAEIKKRMEKLDSRNLFVEFTVE